MIKLKITILLLCLFLPELFLAQSNFETITKVLGTNYEQERKLIITVKKNGNELYKISKKLPSYFSKPEPIVFKNGYSVLIHSLEGKAEFFNNKGIHITTINFLFNKLYNEHKLLYDCKSNSIAMLISENNKNKILLFDSSGNKKDSLQAEDGIAAGIVLSDDSKTLAVSTFNWRGNKIISESVFTDLIKRSALTFPLLFNKGMFDESNKLFTGFTNKNIFNVNLSLKKIFFTKKEEKNKIISDVFYNKNIFFIETDLPLLSNGKWKYNSANIIKIDTKGIPETVQKISTPFYKIIFEKDKNKLLRKTAGSGYLLKIIK